VIEIKHFKLFLHFFERIPLFEGLMLNLINEISGLFSARNLTGNRNDIKEATPQKNYGH